MEQFVQFIQNHWQLGVAFIVISILICINEFLNSRSQGKSITPEEAVNLINNSNAAVIDLRDPAAFKNGHIIGAIRAAEDDFSTPRFNKYKKQDVILVCNRGIQAGALAKTLRAQEYANPMVLKGGIEAWQQASLPLVKK